MLRVELYRASVREAVADGTFDRLTVLRCRITRRCEVPAGNRAVVRGTVGFRWAADLDAWGFSARRAV